MRAAFGGVDRRLGDHQRQYVLPPQVGHPSLDSSTSASAYRSFSCSQVRPSARWWGARVRSFRVAPDPTHPAGVDHPLVDHRQSRVGGLGFARPNASSCRAIPSVLPSPAAALCKGSAGLW